MTAEPMTEEQALVLQTICESGEENFAGLSRSLRMSRGRLAMVLASLKRRGLIVFAYAGSIGDRPAWIRLSNQGRGLMRMLWPESLPAA